MSEFLTKPWVARSPDNDSHALDVYAGFWKIHHGVWGQKKVASLIAAAPDLLTVCRLILDADALRAHAFETVDEGPCIYDMLRAAVGKAEGK